MTQFSATCHQSNLDHLHLLLDTICDVVGEMDFGTAEDRNLELDRVNALVQIARRLAGEISSEFENAQPLADVMIQGARTLDIPQFLEAIKAEQKRRRSLKEAGE